MQDQKENIYGFEIQGDIARGVLPCGTFFLIDADMVDEVSKNRIHLNWKGYPITSKTNDYSACMMLHWIVLGLEKSNTLIVDHINRDKTDCRRSNLRIVTNQQNCMNRGIGKRNKTGYLGTFYNKQRGYYMAKISINGAQIYLLRSESLEECARAYNYASELLFGEFAGFRNPVSEASEELKAEIYEKCKPYLWGTSIARKKSDRKAVGKCRQNRTT